MPKPLLAGACQEAQGKRRRRGEPEIRALRARTCSAVCRRTYRSRIIRRWEGLNPETVEEYWRRAKAKQRQKRLARKRRRGQWLSLSASAPGISGGGLPPSSGRLAGAAALVVIAAQTAADQARGMATADSGRPRSRMPGDPPNSAIWRS